MKVIYSVHVPSSIFKCKLVCLFLTYIPLFIGMLPLPGSSTFDLQEKLEELLMKLQIMKGE